MRKLILLIALCLFTGAAAAQDKGSDKGTDKEKESDSLDLKKLEDKYWSAKDSDFSVVQNRTYSKAGRFFATGSYGVMVNDPNYVGRMANLAVGYYQSEYFGVEVSHEVGDMQDNDSTDFFKNRFGIKPDTNRFRSYTSINAMWVPIYAKMSFLDKKILYFDMQFAVGLGQMTYEQTHDTTQIDNALQNTMGVNFDVTQQIFFHEHWAVRLDIKNKITTQKLDRWRTSGSQSRELDGAKPQQDSSILLGITYFH